MQQLNVDSGDYKVVRLGKQTSQNKSRPLKVIFSDAKIANNCLKNKRKLTGNIFLNADLTPTQRQQFKLCREDLQARKAKGEIDIGIRYTKGTPKVVKLTSKSKN